MLVTRSIRCMCAAVKQDNKSAPQPLKELLEQWQTVLRSMHRSPKTIRSYRDGVRQFLAHCDNTGTPPELTKTAATDFLAALFANGAQPATVRARYSALKRFTAWVAAENIWPTDPLTTLKPPALDTKLVHPLSDAELRDLVKKCQGKVFRDRRDEAIVRLMAETGVRAGECAALLTSDLDTAHGQVTIRRGKGGRARTAPFSPQTAVVLDRYLRVRREHRQAASGALWLGERGGTFGYNGLYRALNRRAALAGIDGFHPHRLRHTAATRWLAAGGSEGGLMAVAGWQSREMLDRYTAATASSRAADEARRLNLGDI
jgi:integrase/recombinase XerD